MAGPRWSWQGWLALLIGLVFALQVLKQLSLTTPPEAEVDPRLLNEYERVIERAQALLKKHANLTQQYDTLELSARYKGLLPPAEPPVADAASGAESAGLLGKGVARAGLRAGLLATSVAPPRARGTGRNLVIGMAQGIFPENLAIFMGSLRQVSDASTVLFMDTPIHPQNRETARKFGATIIEFSADTLQPPQLRPYHPSSYRWPLIHDYVQQHRNDIDRVLMVDVRDSAFQLDPFTAEPSPGFHAYNGVEAKPIAQCGWNGGWVKDCFGQEMLTRIGRNTIICSGVSLGTTPEVLDYLGMMSSTIKGTGGPFGAKFPSCERNGVDQGVHNVLVHMGRIKNPTVHPQSKAMVINLQGGQGVVRDGEVFNKRGEKVAVVHQYDRNKDLERRLQRKYKYWAGGETGAQAKASTATAACSGYEISADVDVYKRVCDVAAVSGSTPDQCCRACSAKAPACTAFTLDGSTCWLKNCRRPHSSGPRKEGAISGTRTA